MDIICCEVNFCKCQTIRTSKPKNGWATIKGSTGLLCPCCHKNNYKYIRNKHNVRYAVKVK